MSCCQSTSPLTREARTWCEARDSADGEPAERSLKGKGGGAKQGIVGMILRELWGWWAGGMVMDLQKNGRCC